jgi:hypothetical protein
MKYRKRKERDAKTEGGEAQVVIVEQRRGSCRGG